MGCSASRSHSLLTRPNQDQHQQQQHKFSNYSSSRSPFSYSFSDSSSTPISRTLSLPTPLVHHPPLCKGDTNHFVSLTSTTYGSLILIDPLRNPDQDPNFNLQNCTNHRQSPTRMAKNQIRADPVDRSSPDTVINTWELMKGLGDDDDDGDDYLGFHIINPPIEPSNKPNSYNFRDPNGFSNNDLDLIKMVELYEIVEHEDSKPLWKHLSEESLLAKMDPNVVSSYRKALSSRPLGFKESKDTNPKAIPPMESTAMSSLVNGNQFYLPGTEDRIVLYYTSLRGIRKTYEDCCSVRMIFRGFRVCVDERDISMDSSFRKELQCVMGVGEKSVSLPQVFIRGKYIGDADEIKQLHELGELEPLLEGFPVNYQGLVCDNCGDARFVPCPNCYGSRKVYEEEEGRQRMCPYCNENGLVRCSNCCF